MGDPDAALMFVGEGPGREEDLAGEPFVGRSGKLLDRLMWEELGLTRDKCYIANVVKCRPPNNRNPEPAEITACRPYLEEQVALIDPKVIITLGQLRHPAAARHHRRHRAVARFRLSLRPGHLVPTYHPAYALRAGGEALAEMRADMVRAKAVMARMSWPLVVHSDSPEATKRVAGRLAARLPLG